LLLAGAWQTRPLGVSAAGSPVAVPSTGVVAKAPLPGLIKDEHLQPVTTTTKVPSSRVLSAPMNLRHSEVAAAPTGTQPTRAMQAATATSASLGFLTRPYLSWHNITSIFDHCNPDYSVDGKVCQFDGAVGLKSNGVDPSFYLGYAQTRGGSDYLSYDGHNGWDYALYYENIYAAAAGTVRLAGIDSVNPCFGTNVIIDHPNGYSTRYGHMSQLYVSPGQVVDRGQVIGLSGNTGCSTGPHLHFGVYITSSWTAVDPWGWSGAPGADPWPSDPGNLWLTGTARFPVPTAPTNVTAIAGNVSAMVNWTPPDFNGGTAIQGYTVAATPGNLSVNVGGSATSAVVGGLTNGTSYTFTVTASNGIANAMSAASNAVVPTGWKGFFRPLTPARLLDTRTGIGGTTGRIAGGQTIEVQVAGSGGVPATGVAAVVLNATVTNASQLSYLTVYPSGIARPVTSNMNFVAGQTLANLALVGVGSSGRISVYNAAGAADVILDVSGWVAADGTTTGTAGIFRPTPSTRILDTRGTFNTLGPGQSLRLQVAGQGGIPATGVSAVVVNLTATNTASAGWLSAFPTGVTTPPTSSINFAAGQTLANRAIVPVGTGGNITLYNGGGRMDVLVDVSGWFSDGTDTTLTGGEYTGTIPTRVLDTRSAGGPVGVGPRVVTIAGLAGVPAMSAAVQPRAVVLNLTVTNPTAASYLTVYPSGASQPATSDLNVTPGATVTNLVVAALGADGKVVLYNAAGSADLIIDVEGWYN
jgi:murein DD-endopeptidase MepM/ murein hydrolase activator NlpD